VNAGRAAFNLASAYCNQMVGIVGIISGRTDMATLASTITYANVIVVTKALVSARWQ
jgi:hypothetical protein